MSRKKKQTQKNMLMRKTVVFYISDSLMIHLTIPTSLTYVYFFVTSRSMFWGGWNDAGGSARWIQILFPTQISGLEWDWNIYHTFGAAAKLGTVN